MDSSELLKKKTNLLLDIAITLMVSGANTNRANTSINRFALVLGCRAFSMISHKTIVMTLTDNHTGETFTKVQNMPSYAINFTTISCISKASWKALGESWSIEKIESEFKKIRAEKKYSRIQVLLAVSLAGAGFCNIFGGDYTNMLVAMLSTFTGLFVLQEAHKRDFNMYFRVLLASFVASSVASLGIVYDIGESPHIALATSILFLVPGVPLINSFTDLLDNNLLNGQVRFTSGLMIVMAMAIGLFGALLIFQV
jgi:uncharacterized membrane protein YjjP (DUF1212 family)